MLLDSISYSDKASVGRHWEFWIGDSGIPALVLEGALSNASIASEHFPVELEAVIIYAIKTLRWAAVSLEDIFPTLETSSSHRTTPFLPYATVLGDALVASLERAVRVCTLYGERLSPSFLAMQLGDKSEPVGMGSGVEPELPVRRKKRVEPLEKYAVRKETLELCSAVLSHAKLSRLDLTRIVEMAIGAGEERPVGVLSPSLKDSSAYSMTVVSLSHQVLEAVSAELVDMKIKFSIQKHAIPLYRYLCLLFPLFRWACERLLAPELVLTELDTGSDSIRVGEGEGKLLEGTPPDSAAPDTVDPSDAPEPPNNHILCMFAVEFICILPVLGDFCKTLPFVPLAKRLSWGESNCASALLEALFSYGGESEHNTAGLSGRIPILTAATALNRLALCLTDFLGCSPKEGRISPTGAYQFCKYVMALEFSSPAALADPAESGDQHGPQSGSETVQPSLTFITALANDLLQYGVVPMAMRLLALAGSVSTAHNVAPGSDSASDSPGSPVGANQPPGKESTNKAIMGSPLETEILSAISRVPPAILDQIDTSELSTLIVYTQWWLSRLTTEPAPKPNRESIAFMGAVVGAVSALLRCETVYFEMPYFVRDMRIALASILRENRHHLEMRCKAVLGVCAIMEWELGDGGSYRSDDSLQTLQLFARAIVPACQRKDKLQGYALRALLILAKNCTLEMLRARELFSVALDDVVNACTYGLEQRDRIAYNSLRVITALFLRFRYLYKAHLEEFHREERLVETVSDCVLKIIYRMRARVFERYKSMNAGAVGQLLRALAGINVGPGCCPIRAYELVCRFVEGLNVQMDGPDFMLREVYTSYRKVRVALVSVALTPAEGFATAVYREQIYAEARMHAPMLLEQLGGDTDELRQRVERLERLSQTSSAPTSEITTAGKSTSLPPDQPEPDPTTGEAPGKSLADLRAKYSSYLQKLETLRAILGPQDQASTGQAG